MTLEWNGIGHSSCRDIISAWKIKQAFLHWIIKNIASFRYEAEEAVQGKQPKNWLSMHKSPLLRIPKINGFCLECNFVLKKCWFEVWQILFKHPVCLKGSVHLSFFQENSSLYAYSEQLVNWADAHFASKNTLLKRNTLLLKSLTLLILGGYQTVPPLADLAVISKGMYQTTPNFLTFTTNIPTFLW